MAKIRIPTPLRAFTDGASNINVAGETVGQALTNLVEQHPDLRAHLFNDAELRSFVNIFIDDEDIRFLQGLDTEIDSGDSLRIIPSIAGGNPPQSPQSLRGNPPQSPQSLRGNPPQSPQSLRGKEIASEEAAK